uniref:Uncharacterized protein n=1 Tax=Spongospora subterranea TaxID=70186 RepID=A0A0H5QRD9_9EUKA|eukprot:CRZ04066.1 hypothetical protein [Spongospora subterranea]
MNADETFALFYREDKMLVPSGTKRVGNLVPVENEKKDVTASSVSSIFSSALYHRYRNVWRRSYASMATLHEEHSSLQQNSLDEPVHVCSLLDMFTRCFP